MNFGFLDFKNSENKQKLLVVVFVFIILITVLTLYSFYFNRQATPTISVSPVTPLEAAKDRGLKIEILNNQLFKSLRKIGEYPVKIEEGEAGRDNPFLPF